MEIAITFDEWRRHTLQLILAGIEFDFLTDGLRGEREMRLWDIMKPEPPRHADSCKCLVCAPAPGQEVKP